MVRALVLMNTDLGRESEVQSELKKIKGVVGTYEVYGVYDIVVEIKAVSYLKLREIILSGIRPLKHVKSTATLISLS